LPKGFSEYAFSVPDPNSVPELPFDHLSFALWTLNCHTSSPDMDIQVMTDIFSALKVIQKDLEKE